MKFDIFNRFTGAVQFTAEIDCAEDAPASIKIGLAIRWAAKNNADLSRAVLSGAKLRGAKLRGADLREADLREADLRWADLSEADLRGADLNGAVLSGAKLRGAKLRGADLREADLREADLRWADLSRAILSGATLSRATLSGADLRGAKLPPDIPVVPDLDAKILALVEAGDAALDMSDWHTCETTHCRAGWAITLAGEAGKKLEDQFGSAAAGTLIYAASCPDLPIPDFYTSNANALADMRARAEQVGKKS